MKKNMECLANRNCIIFDLDDTLYSEEEYVKSGFRAVANKYGNPDIGDALIQLYSDDPRNVFQRFGFSEEQCKECIKIYRTHMPDISLSDNVKCTLESLKANCYKLGIITDGRPISQWNKIIALNVRQYMDQIIVTDELGGEKYRKPSLIAFETMKSRLKTDFQHMVYVGDNPRKDFYVGSKYPILTIQVLKKGLYAGQEYYKEIKPDIQILDVFEILELLNVRV